MPVGGRKDGLPEFSTNHQTTHWLQHWLMKYLSRQSHITCFSCPPPLTLRAPTSSPPLHTTLKTAAEMLCCVCRSDEPWPMENFTDFLAFRIKNVKKVGDGAEYVATQMRLKSWNSCKQVLLNMCCNLFTQRGEAKTFARGHAWFKVVWHDACACECFHLPH